jgi:transcriptional regulator with XRE-family HTH domain
MPERRNNAAVDRAIGHRLRVARAALSISEKEAADAFGVALRTYRRYEAGFPGNLPLTIVKFARKYHISLNWLIDGESDRIGEHLAKGAKGKVAILPVVGLRERWPIDPVLALMSAD